MCAYTPSADRHILCAQTFPFALSRRRPSFVLARRRFHGVPILLETFASKHRNVNQAWMIVLTPGPISASPVVGRVTAPDLSFMIRGGFCVGLEHRNELTVVVTPGEETLAR